MINKNNMQKNCSREMHESRSEREQRKDNHALGRGGGRLQDARCPIFR